MNEIKPLTPFRFWAQKVIPLVYDESLSYYELLCKVIDYLNTMGVDFNELLENFNEFDTDMTEKFNTLSGEFDDLVTFAYEKFPEYVNDKLDEMAANGTLTNLLVPYLPFATPEMFGAVGDGLTDDSEAIQSALDSNKLIYLVNEYLVTVPLLVPENRTVFMNGKINYTLEATLTKKGLITLNNNVHWKGGTFTGSGAITSYNSGNCTFYAKAKNNIFVEGVKINSIPDLYVICLESCDTAVIKNVIITDYTYGGIVCLNGCVNITVDSCTVKNGHETGHTNRYPISGSLFDSDASSPAKPTNIKIINNTVIDDTPFWEGIDFHGGTDCMISNNTVKGVYTGIALVDYDGNYGCDNFVVSRNIIELPLTGESYLKNNHGIIVSRSNKINIEGNIVKNSGYLSSNNDVKASLMISICQDINVLNNQFLNARRTGISLTEALRVLINNNFIEGNPDGDSTYRGILFNNCNKDNSEIVISNNLLHNYFYIYSGMTGASQRKLTKIYCVNNRYYCDPQYSGTFGIVNQQTIIPDVIINPALIGNIVTGEKGDYIRNPDITNATYPYLGWVCTQSATENDAAVWTPIRVPTP